MGSKASAEYVFGSCLHFIVQNLLLSSEVDEVGAHGVFLAAPELVHAEGGGHVLVSHLVPEEKSDSEK